MSDSDDECFVIFGEPLEPLDEENLPRKRAPTIEDQYALDDQGRRRFHGAFTGGFSAGYFNSVDTRDGWRPQQFKSSRSNKAGSISQRPEDFMDDEDTGEFGIAPSGIRATSDFAECNKNDKKRKNRGGGRSYNQETIPGVPVLEELLKPVTDSVGVKLLKKMGWKPGQGVGVRLTKKEKKNIRERNAKKKVYGCAMPGRDFMTSQSDSDNSSDNENDPTVLFAPDDYEPFRCNPKDNHFGIGYSGLDRTPVLSGHVNLFDAPAFQLQEKNKKLSIRGQAFGVGAFEAEDDDIYAKDDMSHYDFTLGPKIKSTKTSSRSKLSLSSPSSSSSTLQSKCIAGFRLAQKHLVIKKSYELPVLPRDFKPIHVIRKSRFEPMDETVGNINQHAKLPRPQLNAQARGKLLGESTRASATADDETGVDVPSESISQRPIQSHETTVAANIITRTLNLNGREHQHQEQVLREQLKNQKSQAKWLDKLNSTKFVCGGVENNNPISTGSLKQLKDFQSTLAPIVSTSSAAADGIDADEFIKSYTTDPGKQQRLQQYFDMRRHTQADLIPLEWSSVENEEYAEALRLFEQKNLIGTLGKSTQAASTITSLSLPKNAEDPAISAAKINMFGKLTRTVVPWQPASTVCKRFNIPEPKSGVLVELQVKKKYSVFESLDTLKYEHKFHAEKQLEDDHGGFRCADEVPSESISTDAKQKENFLTTYETVVRANDAKSPINVALTLQNADESDKILPSSSTIDPVADDKKMDLFKAIFLSSSESEPEDDGADNIDSSTVKSILIGKSVAELNSARNTSPPRGIFAKLDLDNMLAPAPGDNDAKVPENSSEKLVEHKNLPKVCDSTGSTDDDRTIGENKKTLNTSRVEDADIPDMYGPVLPKQPVSNKTSDAVQKHVFKSVVVPKVQLDKAEMKWVEKAKSKKSRKEKKKHKHKEREKKKHKSKRKR